VPAPAFVLTALALPGAFARLGPGGVVVGALAGLRRA
jgi:hypothetical protein